MPGGFDVDPARAGCLGGRDRALRERALSLSRRFRRYGLPRLLAEISHLLREIAG